MEELLSPNITPPSHRTFYNHHCVLPSPAAGRTSKQRASLNALRSVGTHPRITPTGTPPAPLPSTTLHGCQQGSWEIGFLMMVSDPTSAVAEKPTYPAPLGRPHSYRPFLTFYDFLLSRNKMTTVSARSTYACSRTFESTLDLRSG
jgi:hypothetical protein